MYGAGRLESHNILEYEDAARYAVAGGCERFLDCLLAMAEVEWEHEQYFRARVVSHPWQRVFKVWPEPPPKSSIRGRYASSSRSAPSPADTGTPGRRRTA